MRSWLATELQKNNTEAKTNSKLKIRKKKKLQPTIPKKEPGQARSQTTSSSPRTVPPQGSRAVSHKQLIIKLKFFNKVYNTPTDDVSRRGVNVAPLQTNSTVAAIIRILAIVDFIRTRSSLEARTLQ